MVVGDGTKKRTKHTKKVYVEAAATAARALGEEKRFNRPTFDMCFRDGIAADSMIAFSRNPLVEV